MKNVLFAILFFLMNISFLLANSGIYDDAIRVQVNNGGTTEYYFGSRCTDGNGGCAGSNSSTSTNFAGANAGTGIYSLKITWVEVRTFKNGTDDITGANLFYRVYPSGGNPAFVQEGIAFGANLGGDDQRWTETLNIELTTGLLTSTAYTLEIYSTAPFTYTSGSGTHFNNASGSNFKMTFTTNSTFPVELTKFDAKPSGGKVNLAWETASEDNNNYFEVQRSTDAHNWTALEKVSSQNGNAQFNQSYTYTDQRPTKNVNYYRLRQVDFDGSFEYSKVVQASVGKSLGIQVSPNPVSNTLWLTLETDTQASASRIQILDSYGRLLKEWNLNEVPAQQAFPLDLSDIPSGLLFLQIDGQEARRIIKQ